MILRLWELATHWGVRALGFRSTYAETPVGRVHAMVREDGGPLSDLVLIHGISANHGHWLRVLWYLRGHFRRIVVIDLPAHGHSDTPETIDGESLRKGLLAAASAWFDRPVLVVGNSLGGLAAYRFAVEMPERVMALYLNSPGGAREELSVFSAWAEGFRPRSLADGARFVDRLHVRSPWYRWIIAPFVIAKVWSRPVQQILATIQPEDFADATLVRGIRVPVRLVWGSADTLLPAHHFTWWRDAMPEGAEVAVPVMGHCPYLDTPAEFAADVVSFARRVEEVRCRQ